MDVKEAQVWQRVRGEKPEQPSLADALVELLREEWMDASLYLNLSRRIPGKEGAALHRLFQEEQAHAACLKGLYTLITGQRPKNQTVQLPREPVEQMLRRCYGREMRSLTVYEARSGHPEYGHVFARMALQEREHCHCILEILGSLSK